MRRQRLSPRGTAGFLLVVLSLAMPVAGCATLQARTGKAKCLDDGAACDTDEQCCGKCNINLMSPRGTCEHLDP
jgi:hypothetical protein